jgi:hypothetical protein
MSKVRSRTIANTFHVAPAWFVFLTSKACSFGFRYTVQHVFFWVRHSAIAVLSAHAYHELLLNHFFYASVFFIRAWCYARSFHWRQALSNPAFQRIDA